MRFGYAELKPCQEKAVKSRLTIVSREAKKKQAVRATNK